MDKVFVVKRVAEKLWSTEDAIDAAMAENARLMNELIESRRELQVPHQITDGAMSKIAEAMDLLAKARHAMIESHDALYEAQLRIGVRPRMNGGYDSHGPSQVAPEGAVAQQVR